MARGGPASPGRRRRGPKRDGSARPYPGPRILRAAAAAGAAPAGSAALAPATRGPAPRPPPLQLPAPYHQQPGSGEVVGGRGRGREVSATLYLSENRVCWLFGLDA